ncbi:MAG: RNA-binding protein [Phycisphaerae bacterium]|nr:RNA-binding protein [Phycisphaerae bacterium]
MAKNIYVGNLSYGVTDEELRQMFTEFGEVSSANVVMDRETGRSRGFGFVEMPDDGAAQEAINALNGQEQGGRTLTVNEARPRQSAGRGGGYGGGGGGRGGYGGGRGGRGDRDRY